MHGKKVQKLSGKKAIQFPRRNRKSFFRKKFKKFPRQICAGKIKGKKLDQFVCQKQFGWQKGKKKWSKNLPNKKDKNLHQSGSKKIARPKDQKLCPIHCLKNLSSKKVKNFDELCGSKIICPAKGQKICREKSSNTRTNPLVKKIAGQKGQKLQRKRSKTRAGKCPAAALPGNVP